MKSRSRKSCRLQASTLKISSLEFRYANPSRSRPKATRVTELRRTKKRRRENRTRRNRKTDRLSLLVYRECTGDLKGSQGYVQVSKNFHQDVGRRKVSQSHIT